MIRARRHQPSPAGSIGETSTSTAPLHRSTTCAAPSFGLGDSGFGGMNDDDHRCFFPGCVVADFTLSKSDPSLPHQCRPAKNSDITMNIPKNHLNKERNLVKT